MTNESTLDRIIRVVLAVSIAVLYFTGFITGTWAIVLWVVAAILLITGVVGVCPLYRLLGISTKRQSS
jgi:uncharacterized membrane protein required for colicin V production